MVKLPKIILYLLHRLLHPLDPLNLIPDLAQQENGEEWQLQQPRQIEQQIRKEQSLERG
jgi:hypothetical protein